MHLKPSDIHFCQNSIKNTFGNGKRIGDTLDDLCEGRCLLSSFPGIHVSKSGTKWYTTDNRRLWVFQHLYRLGKCGEIPVVETGDIPSSKMTTKNGGVSISVRGGGPGGAWYFKPDRAGANPNGSYDCTWPESSFFSNSTSSRLYSSSSFLCDSDEYSDNSYFGCSDNDSFSDNDFW